MHPILISRGGLASYFLSWLLIGFLLAALFVFSDTYSWSLALSVMLPMIIVYAFLNLSTYYLCRAFPIGVTPLVKLVLPFLGASFISAAVWTLAGNGWILLLEAAFELQSVAEPYSRQVPMVFGIGVLLFLLSTVVHYVLITAERARDSERRSYELRLLAQDAELRLLRAQIDPHFLFNSLNSISSLIVSSPDLAREMTVRLADFLRKSLHHGSQQAITVRQEVALITDYLAVEQIRFGERLKVEISMDEETGSLAVPPLLLQPLVENAVRHGIAHLLDGGCVRVRSSRTSQTLHLVVDNPCDDARPRQAGTGVGLENVRNRLHRLYGNDARVDVEESNDYFEVTLQLPAVPHE